MTDTADFVESFIHEYMAHHFKQPAIAREPDAEWGKVRDTGSCLWLDTGDIDEASRLWCSEFEALTTNNTLLNREVQKGMYDSLVAEAATELRAEFSSISESRLVLEIALILNAVHGLRLVQQFGAHVSVELHTDLAHDTERTIEYARRLYHFCPERFFIKIPFTAEGAVAARLLGEEDVPVNFTLGFSARQNYFAACYVNPEFVNVFLGRLGAFVSASGLGSGTGVGEKATLSAQNVVSVLRQDGRTDCRLIAASMRDGGQVATLAGVDVLTMPVQVAEEYRELLAVSPTHFSDRDMSIGVNEDARFINTLWDVTEPFMECVDALMQEEDLAEFEAEDISSYFSENGVIDFLPQWDDDQIERVEQDGKIPDLTFWRDSLESRSVGMDALMTLCALYSFRADQAALDDRIRSLI